MSNVTPNIPIPTSLHHLTPEETRHMRMDTMEIDDDIFINKNFTMDRLIPRAGFQKRKKPSRCLGVCLGVLLVLLLAGNVGQVIYHEVFSRQPPANPTQATNRSRADQPQSSNGPLYAERRRFEVRLKNLTREKDLLLESLNSLATERDAFKRGLNALRNERDELQASYNESKREGSRLKTISNDTRRGLEKLRANYSGLTARAERLQFDNTRLQRQNVALNASLNQAQRIQLALKTDNEQLRRSNINQNRTGNLFRFLYKSLQNSTTQLTSRYEAVQREKEQLQRNYSILATARDQLQRDLWTAKRAAQNCNPGWRKFNMSCYFVLTSNKNWTSSRQDCISRGADLAVINSKKEQVFIYGLIPVGQHTWIGLTDSHEEGTWKWVDGTPLTITFWHPGQPNSLGEQDCVELVPDSAHVGTWNDEYCSNMQLGVCEK